MPVEVGHGGAQHDGLARTGGTDDHDQPVTTGDRRGSVGLEHVESVAVHGRRRVGFGELGVDRPCQDLLFLGDHLPTGDVRGDWFDPQRTTIRYTHPSVAVCGVEIDALAQHPLDGHVHQLRPPFTGQARLRAEPIGHRLEDVHTMPRRPFLGQVLDDIGHRHLRRREGDAGGSGDRVGQRLGSDAERRCFASPP